MNLLKNLNGLQHIGIPVTELERSVEFYTGLGFEVNHRKDIVRNGVNIRVAFMKLSSLVLEIYESEGNELEEIKQRKHGHIDHIALDVKNIEEVFQYLLEGKYKLLDNEIQYIPFFEKGVRFFTIEGPDGEKVEFNEKCS
jgi:lactoylglutathione lyase